MTGNRAGGPDLLGKKRVELGGGGCLKELVHGGREGVLTIKKK